MPAFNHEKTIFNRVRPQYARIAQLVQAIISSHITPEGRIDDVDALERDLRRYSLNVEAWATAFWLRQDESLSRSIARDFKRVGLTVDPQSPVVRAAVERLHREQVDLIKTLPIDSGKKAQDMARRAAMETGKRAEMLIDQLRGMKPGYPEYAARRLARTETAKAQAALVQTQSSELGIKQYVWRTVRDEAVRDSHAAMEGKVCDWDNPPEVEPGLRHHPGGIYNCRCYSEPLLPKVKK